MAARSSAGAQHGVQFIQQASPQPRHEVGELRRGPGQYLHQGRIAQCGREVDPLLLERCAIIEGARVAKISYQPRSGQEFDALPGAHRNWIARRAFIKKIARAQAAAHARPSARRLHLFEIDVIAHTPRQPQGIGTQHPAPA